MSVESAPSPFTETTGPARHLAYRELAASGPVRHVMLFTGVPAWLITGYAEARELLAHPAVVKTVGGPHWDVTPIDVREAVHTHLLSANPPDHTRLRRLVSAAFTQRRIEALTPRIQEVTDGLLDDLAAAGAGGQPVDLVARFGYPLPLTVITEMLGVPLQRQDDFRRWSFITVNGAVHPADTYIAAATEMLSYVRELIAEKRAEPGEDLLSGLVTARDGSDRLTEDELTSMVFLLLIAGHETTVNLICNGVHALLTHPDQLALLRAEPQRMSAAVEEMLRYDGPVQVPVPAVTAAPVEVAGVTIPAGEVVLPALLAANRDGSRYAEPDRFDITREPAQHLAFGHGLHHCLGAPLARLEGRIGIGSLLARFPGLKLAEPSVEPARNPAMLMNALVELPVVVG
jgi:cytochrome P450